MSEPYFVSNDIFRGPRGADCAYLMQNVIEAQGRHMRHYPRRGQQRKKEAPTVIGEFVRLLSESGNIQVNPEQLEDFLRDEKREAKERRQRAREALIARMAADSDSAGRRGCGAVTSSVGDSGEEQPNEKAEGPDEAKPSPRPEP